MKRLYIFLIVIVNIILQITLYNFVKIYDIVPNIALILIVLFSLTTNEYMGGLIGLLTGLLYDILVMDIIGINTLIYFVVGVTLGHFSEEINKENKFLYVLITAIASVFYHLVTAMVMFFLRMNVSNTILILDKIIFQIILNSLLCIPVQMLVNYLLSFANIKLFNNKL